MAAAKITTVAGTVLFVDTGEGVNLFDKEPHTIDFIDIVNGVAVVGTELGFKLLGINRGKGPTSMEFQVGNVAGMIKRSAMVQ